MLRFPLELEMKLAVEIEMYVKSFLWRRQCYLCSMYTNQPPPIENCFTIFKSSVKEGAPIPICANSKVRFCFGREEFVKSS